MRKQKSNIAVGQLALTAILLVASVSLVIGTVLARYQVTDFDYLEYAAREPDQVYIWSGYDETTGTFLTDAGKWVRSDGKDTLEFYISNGTADAFAENAQQVYIRLIASGAVADSVDDMLVGLEIRDDTVTEYFPAAMQMISEGTPLHETFGDGWAFMFRDENGDELSWTLEGEKLSVLPAQIVVQGLDANEAVLLQLQVTGQ